MILGAVDGGGELVGVQLESVATTDEEPSPTVALQVLERKPDPLTLKSPFEPARPVADDSGDDTVIVAFASAPRPSTESAPPLLSDALVTLTAASAPGGARSAPAVRSVAIARNLRLPA